MTIYKWDIELGVDAVFNTSSFNKSIDAYKSAIAKVPPVNISQQMGDFELDYSSAQRLRDSVQEIGMVIDDVSVKEKALFDKHGEYMGKMTDMTAKYRDENGLLITDFKRIKEEIDGTQTIVGSSVSTRNPIADRLKAVQKEYQTIFDNQNKFAKTSELWAEKANNMDEKKKKLIQDTNTELQKRIGIYQQSVMSGDTKNIEAQKASIDRLIRTQESHIASTQRGAGAVRKWTDHLANAVKQTIAYTFTIGAMRKAIDMMNKVMEYTIELNSEMVKIQVLQAEGAQTDADIKNLASAYNDLATELGATTLEVAQGSVEWLRQGKTVAETTELLRSSTMLSKLGNLSAAESTEYLTSTLNSYKIGTEEAIGVVDKLIQVDNIAATSTKELATALRYSAATASEAGVSLEELISYIAVVSSTTRQNAESIGQGMKTMLTRMQDIKAGAIDEDGLGLNNVESALARVDIKLRINETTFRDFSDVLEDVAAQWGSLNDIEQANISKAIAGIRQQNLFNVLMQNMGTALEYQEEQYNATGVAADRYGFYLDSIEGSQNKLTASLEKFYMTADGFDDLLILINNLAAGFLNLLSSIGGLPTILTTTLAVLIAIKNVDIAVMIISAVQNIAVLLTNVGLLNVGLTGTKFSLALLNKELGITMAMTPIGWLALLAGAFYALSKAIKSPTERLEKFRKEVGDLRSDVQQATQTEKAVKSLAEQYDELYQRKQKIALTAQEDKKLLDIQNQLHDLLPELSGRWDEYGNYILDATNSTDLLTESSKKLKEAQDALANDDSAKKRTNALGMSYTEAQAAARGIVAGRFVGQDDKEAKAILEGWATAIASEKAEFRSLGEEAQQEYIDGIKNKELKQIFIDYQGEIWRDAVDTASSGRYRGMMSQAGIKIPVVFENVEESLDKLSELEEAYTSVSEAVTEFGADSVEAYDAMRDALPAGSELKDYLTASGEVNLELLQSNTQLYLEELRAYVTTAEGITEEELNFALGMISKLESSMQTQVYTAINGIRMTSSEYANWAGEISGFVYSMANNAGFVLHDLAGNELASAENIKIALINKAITYEQMVQQMVNAGITGVNMLDAAVAQSASYFTEASPYQAVAPDFSSAGGGGGGGESAESIRLQGEIDALNDKKDALNDMLDEYKKYIDAQKELLKLKKEEKEFEDEIMKKNLSLAKLKTNIALLALDDSEEARASRLQLEEDAADLEEEIATDKEDRKYELQMNALEKAQSDYEDYIESQIKGLEDVISKYEDEKSAISSTGGAVGNLTQQVVVFWDNMASMYADQLNLSEENMGLLDKQIQKWKDMGYDIDTARQLAWDYAQALATAQLYAETYGSQPGDRAQFNQIDREIGKYHDGGIVGDMKGASTSPLKSTEVFARLLKNEGVFTEGQMNKFITETLPSMMSNPITTRAQSDVKAGDVNIDFKLTVTGNADRTTIKEIKRVSLEAMNEALASRGVKRNASSLAI